MVTAQELQANKALFREHRAAAEEAQSEEPQRKNIRGVGFEEIHRPAGRAHWWKADGTYVGYLKADPYHFGLYVRRGFLLAHPDDIKARVERIAAERAAKEAEEKGEPVAVEAACYNPFPSLSETVEAMTPAVEPVTEPETESESAQEIEQ